MDAVGKRQTALAIFLLIQSVKLYEWWSRDVSVDNSGYALVFKWALIESALLLVLQRMQVPRLHFTLGATMLIALAFIFFNCVLIVWLPWCLSYVRDWVMPLSFRDHYHVNVDSIDDIAGSREKFIQGTIMIIIMLLLMV